VDIRANYVEPRREEEEDVDKNRKDCILKRNFVPLE
jgi:hypothetical protein